LEAEGRRLPAPALLEVGTSVGLAVGVLDGMAVSVAVAVGTAVSVAVGEGVSVGKSVAVGSSVLVGGTSVAVGGSAVAVDTAGKGAGDEQPTRRINKASQMVRKDRLRLELAIFAFLICEGYWMGFL